MKKTIKSKLRLNSQTIRALRLEQVQGGRPVDDSIDICLTDRCSVGCRNCG
jgi:hypothetical protein